MESARNPVDNPARRRLLAQGAAALLAPTFAGGALAQASQVSLVASSLNMSSVQVVAALGLNTFKGNALDVKLVAPATSSASVTLAALISGGAEFAWVGATSVMDLLQEGAPVVILTATTFGINELGLSNAAAAKLRLPPNATLRQRVEALRGLTIATAPTGSLLPLVFNGLLKQHGMKESDVKLVPSDPTAIIAGIEKGLYDGAFWSVGVLERPYSTGGATPWINPPDLLDLNGKLMQGVTITTAKTLKERPEIVRAFVKSMEDAASQIAGSEAAARAAIKAKAYDSTPEPVFDLIWKNARPAFVLGDMKVTKKMFDEHLQLQRSLTGKAYDKVKFEGSVHVR